MSLIQEWQAFVAEQDGLPHLQSIYFGGGTPSLMPTHLLEKIIQTLKASVAADVEITLEANPENLVADAGKSYLAALKSMGFNRLSIGAQSFSEKQLQFLGRNHQGKEIRRAVDHARHAAFSNISLDVIGFLPDEPLDEAQSNLQEMIKCDVEHLSFYGLTIEEKTLFYQQKKQGMLTLPSDEVSTEQYEMMVHALADAGYEQYEISNFSRPGFRSRHNQCYWTYRPYLGLGAGAHSFFRMQGRQLRTTNIASPEKYVEIISKSGEAVAEEEVLEGRSAMAEFVFTGLRRREGILAEDFFLAFNQGLLTVYSQEISKFLDCELLQWTEGEGGRRLHLTSKGILLSDTVFAEFT